MSDSTTNGADEGMEYAFTYELNPETGRVEIVYMHDKIMQPGPDEYVEHLNGNGLDNRRSNLRIRKKWQRGEE